MGPTVGLDGCGKSRPLLRFDSWAFQPVARSYIAHAIPIHTLRVAITQCGRGLSTGLPFGRERINKHKRKFRLSDIFRFLGLSVSSVTVFLSPTYTRSALFRNRA
jgi:hypothetical protein